MFQAFRRALASSDATVLCLAITARTRLLFAVEGPAPNDAYDTVIAQCGLSQWHTYDTVLLMLQLMQDIQERLAIQSAVDLQVVYFSTSAAVVEVIGIHAVRIARKPWLFA